MNTRRRLAKEISCPKTTAELKKYVDEDLVFQNQHLCRALQKHMYKWAGKKNLRKVGPKKFGVKNYRDIFVDFKLPSFKNVLKIAKKLDLNLVWKNYPLSQSFARYGGNYCFEEEFEHAEFMAILSDLCVGRSNIGDSQEMRKERERIFANFRYPDFPVYWSTVIRYAAACGYQVTFNLDRKDDRKEKPPARIDGCLTPAKVDDKSKTGEKASFECAEGLCDSGDYTALLRRLNYPA